MRSLIINVVLCVGVFGIGTVQSDVGDHVSSIQITQGIDYENPDESWDDGYDFTLIIWTDAHVEHIIFRTPAGNIFEIPNDLYLHNDKSGTSTSRQYDDDQDAWEWNYERNLPDSTFLHDYGDGDYLITIHYAIGIQQTNVWYGIPDSTEPIPQPTQIPRLTSPQPYSGTDSPVTFSWNPCTDANANAIWAGVENETTNEEFDVGTPLSPTDTQWGGVALDDGIWEIALSFAHGYLGLQNDDGIELVLVKYAESENFFRVGNNWVDFEVWAGDTDYSQMPDEWWEYYRNPEWTDFVKLGDSQDQPRQYCGQYKYYLVRPYRPLLLDAVRASDGTYQSNWPWHLHGWGFSFENLNGPPDRRYATVGDWIIFENPGHWQCITLITEQNCPTADLTDDCFVDFADLAELARQWLTGYQQD